MVKNVKSQQGGKKFLPVFIFILIGLATAFYSLSYFTMHCQTPDQQKQTCDLWNIFCHLNNLIVSPGQDIGYVACLSSENNFRIGIFIVGASIAIIALLKY